MKRIVAFIKPNMLDDVIFALYEVEDFPGASMFEIEDPCSKLQGISQM